MPVTRLGPASLKIDFNPINHPESYCEKIYLLKFKVFVVKAGAKCLPLSRDALSKIFYFLVALDTSKLHCR